jgi:hypothetical protein
VAISESSSDEGAIPLSTRRYPEEPSADYEDHDHHAGTPETIHRTLGVRRLSGYYSSRPVDVPLQKDGRPNWHVRAKTTENKHWATNYYPDGTQIEMKKNEFGEWLPLQPEEAVRYRLDRGQEEAWKAFGTDSPTGTSVSSGSGDAGTSGDLKSQPEEQEADGDVEFWQQHGDKTAVW